eukprot:COSAG04_NODE_27811_length_279_cov_1.438889_1_plen_30_part_10
MPPVRRWVAKQLASPVAAGSAEPIGKNAPS